jgi:hypothetical protein
MTTFFPTDADLHFPDSDGKPMADNTEQFRWIVLSKTRKARLERSRKEATRKSKK